MVRDVRLGAKVRTNSSLAGAAIGAPTDLALTSHGPFTDLARAAQRPRQYPLSRLRAAYQLGAPPALRRERNMPRMSDSGTAVSAVSLALGGGRTACP